MSPPEDVSPRAVVFDLGGVILRICRTWEEGCRAVDVPVRPDGLARMHETDLETLVFEYQSGRVPFAAFAEELAVRSGGSYSREEVERVHRGWIRGEYAGALRLITGLRRAGVPTVALSNTCPVHWEQMPDFPAFAAIEHRIGSHLVGACKPDAAMYEAAEAAVAAVAGADPGDDPAGGRIVFFDDTPPNIVAARERGWDAHVIDPHGDPPAAMATVLRHLGVNPGADVDPAGAPGT